MLYTQRSEFFNLTSQESGFNQAYLENFQALIYALQTIGGSISNDPSLISRVCHQYGLTSLTLNGANIMQVKKDANKWYYTIEFLLGDDRCQYGRLPIWYRQISEDTS